MGRRHGMPRVDLQPLGVLVEHRVDDVDERLVAVEQPVPPGQQVTLEPALAQVLRQHLHHPAVRGQLVIARDDLPVEGPAGHVEHRVKPVRGRLVRSPQPEGPGVPRDDVPQEGAEHAGVLRLRAAGRRDRDRVVPEVGHVQVVQQQTAVGVRVGAHPPVVRRRQPGDLGYQRAAGVEQLGRAVGAHPLLELPQVLRVGPRRGDRHLVRPPGSFHRQPVDELRPGPALGRAQHEHRPARPPGFTAFAGSPLDVVDLGHDRVEGGGHLLVHQLRVVALDRVDLVPVPGEQRFQFAGRDPGRDRRVGDLVPVEVQDRQHRAVRHRVEELVGVPAAGERPGLRLAVPDHAGDDELRVVERRPVGVRQRVTELAALVDGSGRLRRHVRRYAAGEGELPEEPSHPGLVLADRRVQLGIGAFQVGVRHDPRAAVPWPGDVDDVQVPVLDHPVQVRVDQVEARRGAPVPEQPGLHVLWLQFLGQQRIVHQVDLADGQVVGCPPPSVDEVEFAGRERPSVRRCHAGPLVIPNVRVVAVGSIIPPRPGGTGVGRLTAADEGMDLAGPGA